MSHSNVPGVGSSRLTNTLSDSAVVVGVSSRSNSSSSGDGSRPTSGRSPIPKQLPFVSRTRGQKKPGSPRSKRDSPTSHSSKVIVD